MKRNLCLVLAILVLFSMLGMTACSPKTPVGNGGDSGQETSVAPKDATETSNGTSSGATKLDKITYVVPRSAEVVEDAYIWVAEKMGYFEELGIEPEVMPSYGTSDTKMVMAGQADICLPSPYVGIMAVEGGVDIVYPYQMMQKYHFGFAVNPNKGITSIEQLAGKKIVLGDAGWSIISNPILHAYGVDIDSVEYVIAADNRAQVGWAGTDADAVLTWYMEFEEWQSAGMEFDYLDCEEKFHGVANGLAVSKATMADEAARDRIARFLKGVAMGSYFVALNPEAAAEIVLEKYPQITTSFEVTTEILKSFGNICVTHEYAVEHGLGALSAEKWQYMIDIGVELGQVAGTATVDQLIDNSLVSVYNDFDHARVEKDAADYVLASH